MDCVGDKIRSCTKCSLCEEMPGTKPVPGVGPTNARIMLVGEALGEDESLLEEPFVGACGQFMDQMLQEAGLNRGQLFITNVVKCRPTKPGGRSNRPPTEDEIQSCKLWLWKEIQLVEPKVIITLGKVPTYTLLRLQLMKSFTLGHLIGRVRKVDYTSADIIPCYHPSFTMVHGRDKREAVVNLFKEIKGKYA